MAGFCTAWSRGVWVLAALAILLDASRPACAQEAAVIGRPQEALNLAIPEGLAAALTAGFYNKYVSRGQLNTNGPVFEPSLNLAYKGFSVNFWGNVDLCNVNDNQNEMNEVDITGQYQYEWNSFTFSVGAIYYDYPHTPFKHVTEATFGVSYDGPVRPSLSVYADVDDLDKVYASADLFRSFPLPKVVEWFDWSVDVGAGMGFGTRNYNLTYFQDNNNAAVDFHSAVSVPFTFRKHWTVSPMVGWSSVLDGALRRNSPHPDNLVAGLVLSARF